MRICNAEINIPFHVGRVDATEAGLPGVLNVTGMVGLVARGHTIGGVHAEDFPNITQVFNVGNLELLIILQLLIPSQSANSDRWVHCSLQRHLLEF